MYTTPQERPRRHQGPEVEMGRKQKKEDNADRGGTAETSRQGAHRPDHAVPELSSRKEGPPFQSSVPTQDSNEDVSRHTGLQVHPGLRPTPLGSGTLTVIRPL